MAEPPVDQALESSEKKRKKLRGELWILVPFFAWSAYVFFGSFRYKFEAATVPMLLGFATLILVGMRLFHVVFPHSRIGRFEESGLAGEFDHIKEEIEEETLKGHYEDQPTKQLTFRDEGKAFLALIYSCMCFILFGYVVGAILVVIGTTYYYGYRKIVPIIITSASVFVLLYVVLYRLFGAEITWGLVLEPVLNHLDWI